jgi:hypothetical protein
MDTRTHEKIVPAMLQPAVTLEPDGDVYAWSPRRHQDDTPFVLTGEEEDDEPAPDVGGEVGKTPRLLTAWQITGLVFGGIAIAAGIAGAIYLSRPRRN